MKAFFLVSMDRDPIKKGFLLVWPQCCCIMKRCPVASYKLVCAAWAFLRVCANVLSATRSFDEKGRPFCISYLEPLSFLTEVPSQFCNRIFLHTPRMLGSGWALLFCVTSMCVAGSLDRVMIDQLVTIGCAFHGVRRTDLWNAETVRIASDVEPNYILNAGRRSKV
jgi:hypothetical protein